MFICFYRETVWVVLGFVLPHVLTTMHATWCHDYKSCQTKFEENPIDEMMNTAQEFEKVFVNPNFLESKFRMLQIGISGLIHRELIPSRSHFPNNDENARVMGYMTCCIVQVLFDLLWWTRWNLGWFHGMVQIWNITFMAFKCWSKWIHVGSCMDIEIMNAMVNC